METEQMNPTTIDRDTSLPGLFRAQIRTHMLYSTTRSPDTPPSNDARPEICNRGRTSRDME
jgi:hypothetical protein